MRVAWFSPLPPVRSGIAAYSAELLPRLSAGNVIDSYPESAAHDFVWRMRRNPYDLVVYQLGNAPCHDYMWAYLARYPGLVVLHDAKLHHARARQLLQRGRADDYRAEFAYDHPHAGRDVAEYAVEGLGGAVYYLWPMLRVVMTSARLVAVHNPRVADDLRAEYPDTTVDPLRMGIPPLTASPGARNAIRRALSLPHESVLFAAFGKVTAEKRVSAMLKALATLTAEGRSAHLMLVGDADAYTTLARELAEHGVGDRVRVTGHVPDEAIADHLAAADACLCLRWPTAQESSASWLRCLAAARATVLTDLAHLFDIPHDVAMRVDLVDEDATLLSAMRTLADDAAVRNRIARAGHAYWAAHHTLDHMAADYERVLVRAASRRAPAATCLPAHFTADYSTTVTRTLDAFGLPANLLA